MKQRHILAVLMLLVCLSIFGQQPKTVPIQEQPPMTSTQVSTNQQELILQLQAENAAMQKQLEKMEKEIELYRGDVRDEASRMNTNMGLWLAVLTIIMAILGVVIPLILNNRNEKSMDKMLEDAKNDAKQAIDEIKEVNRQVSIIQEKINKDTIATEKAAKETKASQFFAQAMNEKIISIAIELYNQAVALKPEFCEAYSNRGNLKFIEGDRVGALADYDKAITLKSDYADAYNNRGLLKSNMGDRVGALADYDKAITLKPDYADAYNNRGILRSEMGDQAGALADYDKAIILKSDYAGAYNNRGKFQSWHSKIADE